VALRRRGEPAYAHALVQYMAEQNLIAQPLPIEDLFVPLPGLLES
jgi:hypothetical protein